MKKILFNDKFGLTQAVLDGRKTQTRRIVSERLWDRWTEYDDYCNSVGVSGLSEIGVSVTREYYGCEKFFLDNSPYKVGEVVAVAQSYKDCGYDPNISQIWTDKCVVIFLGNNSISQTSGWNNKLFVQAVLMPHRIRITDVRVERLNDISESDCLAEGIYLHTDGYYSFPNSKMGYDTPREAYAALIDKISSKGTWLSNPYVFVYEFELVK